MRILHLSSLYPPLSVGGAERVVETLATGMAARGHAVGVAHLAPRPLPDERRDGVDILRLRHRNPLWIEQSARYPGPIRQLNKVATLFNVLTTRDFAATVERFRPDIVHSHSMVELPPAMWQAAKSGGARLVHTLHDYDLLCIRAALFKDRRNCAPPHAFCRLFSTVKRRQHTHIDQVVGVTQAVLDRHLDAGLFAHLQPVARHVVWNPLTAAFTRRPRHDAAAELPLIFGFLGRLVAEKGIHVLLDAARRLGPGNWQLKVAGRAPDGVEALAAEVTGLPVTFVGEVDPVAFLAGIDLLVVPAIWYEPFGLTVIEAVASGVPVLGPDRGGVGEILASIDRSWTVAAESPVALADRLAALVERGRSALPRVPEVTALLARTAPANVVATYLDIYAQALNP